LQYKSSIAVYVRSFDSGVEFDGLLADNVAKRRAQSQEFNEMGTGPTLGLQFKPQWRVGTSPQQRHGDSAKNSGLIRLYSA